jgi:hypothetical protein
VPIGYDHTDRPPYPIETLDAEFLLLCLILDIDRIDGSIWHKFAPPLQVLKQELVSFFNVQRSCPKKPSQHSIINLLQEIRRRKGRNKNPSEITSNHIIAFKQMCTSYRIRFRIIGVLNTDHVLLEFSISKLFYMLPYSTYFLLSLKV